MRISDWSSDGCSSDLIGLHGIGATLAERQIVLAGAAFVGMTLDDNLPVRILLEPGGLLVEGRLAGGLHVILVEIEEDAVADVDLKVLNRTGRNAGGRRTGRHRGRTRTDRKSTRLNSSH